MPRSPHPFVLSEVEAPPSSWSSQTMRLSDELIRQFVAGSADAAPSPV